MDNSQQLTSTSSKPEEHGNLLERTALAKDNLTGLYSLEAFSHQLDQLIADSIYTESPMTLLLLQLANFYEIRTWIGKNEANFLLNDLARLLEKTVPANSLLCRCHNHEFAVLLVDEGSRKSLRTADSIKLALQSSSLQTIPPQLDLKCGVGLTGINEYTPRSEVAFARARHNMSRHHDQQPIGQSFTNFSQQQTSQLLKKLTNAIETERYKLSYQATVSFTEDGLRHFELRSRLSDKESSLPAAAFLETVIQNALGVALDRWVIEQAITLLRADSDGNLQLTVNLTQNSLVSRSFLKWLKTVASDPSLDIRMLVLQISELDVLIAQHHLEAFCHVINSLGIRLCISHFGSTHDPLRYLPLLKAHYIKLDQSLTELVATDRSKHQQLEALIHQIHDRGMKVIAPMVEQIEELPLLWDSGVDFVQGYCLHKPGTDLNFEFIKNQELTVT